MKHIRPAQIDDLEAISKLSEHLGYTALPADIAHDNLQTIIDSTQHHLAVYQADDRILGWIHGFVAHRVATLAFVEIGGLVVDPTQRRKGIAALLVEDTQAWARKQQLSLRVRCNSQRDQTLAFYAAVGFKPVKNQAVLESS